MSIVDPTRRDAGQSSRTLTIHIEYDLDREYTSVETNIVDTVVFMRIMSNALQVKANDAMRQRAELSKRRIAMPKVEM